MILGQAREIFQGLLEPMGVDAFLDEKVERSFFKLEGALNASRRGEILGSDPERAILSDFARSGHRIISHAKAPLGPPPPLPRMTSPEAFKAKIEAFHALGYTVRLSEMRALTPALDQLVRAIEFIFQKPSQPDIYWSRGGASAPVHHDDYDLFAIQVKGKKRWYLSTDPLTLPNTWRPIPGVAETLGANPQTIDVEPGDLLYLPRGVVHAVDALSESIHVSIGLAPLTVREALIACIDQMAEDDLAFRETASSRIAEQLASGKLGDLPDRLRQAFALALKYAQSDDYVGASLQRRASRAIGEFQRLRVASADPTLSLATRLRQNPVAVAHLSANASNVDFAYPGGHLFINKSAEEAVRFIAGALEFQIRDIPGEIGDDIRVALAARLIAVGFLEVVA